VTRNVSVFRDLAPFLREVKTHYTLNYSIVYTARVQYRVSEAQRSTEVLQNNVTGDNIGTCCKQMSSSPVGQFLNSLHGGNDTPLLNLRVRQRWWPSELVYPEDAGYTCMGSLSNARRCSPKGQDNETTDIHSDFQFSKIHIIMNQSVY
jgi:hypothetical protein